MHCLNCQHTEDEAPLLTLHYQGKTLYICAQCLPILIHKSHLLTDKLSAEPGTQGGG